MSLFYFVLELLFHFQVADVKGRLVRKLPLGALLQILSQIAGSTHEPRNSKTGGQGRAGLRQTEAYPVKGWPIA